MAQLSLITIDLQPEACPTTFWKKVFTFSCSYDHFLCASSCGKGLSNFLSPKYLDMKENETELTLTKDRLIEIIEGLVRTDVDLSFLLKLEKRELETLAACIRERIDRPEE